MSRLGAASSPNSRTRGRSGSGTPKMSLMIATGSCEQYRPTMSITSETPASAGQLIQEVGCGLLDAVTQRGDRPGSEHRRHRLAVAGVVGRLDGQQRRCAQRMQQIVARAALQPAQRRRQIRAHVHHPEVVGSQQLVGEGVVGGQVVDAAFHQRPLGAQFARRTAPDRRPPSDRRSTWPAGRPAAHRSSRRPGRSRASRASAISPSPVLRRSGGLHPA